MRDTDTDNEPLSQADADHALVLRMLHEEQTRLRSELDELRKKQDEQKSEQKDEKGPDDEGDEEKQEGDSEGDKSKNNGKGGGDKDEGGEKEKNKEEDKKPPLKERVQKWTREHPKGRVLVVIGFAVLGARSPIGTWRLAPLWCSY